MNPETDSLLLSYVDKDDDLIRVTTTRELMDVVELFSDEKFVRLTTCIKRKVSRTSQSTSEHATAKGARDSSSRKNSTGDDHHPVPPQIRVVLESFAGILSNAVNNLQEGLATHSHPIPSKKGKNHSPGTNKTNKNKFKVDQSSTNFHRTKSSPKSRPNYSKSNHQSKDRSMMPPYCENVTPTPMELFPTKIPAVTKPSQGLSSVQTNELNELTNEARASTEGSTNPRPFIHGRHTCDGCLTTPIVGKRYRATNLPDYDLCEHCFHNYKGNEIKLEPVELSRDQAFQVRWHHRHRKAVMAMKTRTAHRSLKTSEGNKGAHGCSNLGDNSALSRQKKTDPVASNACPSSPAFTSVDANTNQSVQHNKNQSSEFDLLLKEAIRRSLDDIKPKTGLSMELQTKKENSDIVLDSNMNSDLCVENDGIPSSVQIVGTESGNDESTFCDDDCMSDTQTVQKEQIIAKDMERVMSTDSVDSEKLLSEAERSDVLSPIRKFSDLCSDTPASTTKISKNTMNESFASDAVGNGDVAEVMGKTLDMVAGVISEMLSETEESNCSQMNNNVTGDSELAAGEVVVPPDTEKSEHVGEAEEDPDWSVVQSVGSNGTTESQKIGKATEMLGSALFNSDMNVPGSEKESKLVASGTSFSLPSSVLTDVGTVNTDTVRCKGSTQWSSELEKLNELGFRDEGKCIAILERVGPSSNAIDLVVNELLELNE